MSEPNPTTGYSPLALPAGHYWSGDRMVPFDNYAEEAVRTLLRLVGRDPSSAEVKDTPKRVVKALVEMTEGSKQKPEDVLGTTFEEEGADSIVLVRNIPFTSLCEHHLLIVEGTADVAYLPSCVMVDAGVARLDGDHQVRDKYRVVGLSKIPRLVDLYTRRLSMQERFTREIAVALTDVLKAEGAAVVTRATHSCMSCRGVRKSGADMVCSSMLGAFRDDQGLRSEFLSLCQR